MPTLKISLFGNLHISLDGDRTVELEPATRSMLAYLLLYQYRRPRTARPRRELLANQFWSDYEERQARRCLSTALWRLRRSLEAEGIPGDAYIVTNNDEVGFNFASDHWLDVTAFEEKMAQGMRRPVASMTEADARALQEALSLYVGDLFEDCYDDWILRHRERLHLQYLSSLGRLMQYFEAKQLFGKALAYGRKILSVDPLREQIHRYLMRLYVRNDQPGLAVQQYETCERILHEELGIAPMAETQTLYQRIISGKPLDDVTAVSSEPQKSLQQALQQLRQAMHALADAQDRLDDARELVVELAREKTLDSQLRHERLD
ncbi:MAG TPA: BTAD domain-containing putative transcriptional regulator [Candidatus Sulfomarinibacteraceae bacterium]|nr:BTAD domain-containing putative transcriptional regulator [Candidatus Sulfomarinibacteraceae bacterium]